MGCLSKLKDAGAISVIPGGVGFESTYLWNVEMFKTGVEFCVLRTYLGKTCTPPVQDLHTPYAQLAHLPRQAVHSSYLELLLKLNIEFFIADAAKSDEENSPATQGDKKAALDSASVSDEMVAAWIAAGRKMASIHGFNVVALVISHHRPLDFGSSDPEGLLASILTSFQAMADLLTVHADELYSNDTEWMAAMYHRYGEISKYNLEKGVQ